eukprot:TRINITY_DN42538_c0_g1_i1.p1 TRINITY_DN42538_c0_g1~~TRINITY_DN42538_c0_g1_i1.p1  ORF type:complete len:524 (-),score=88.77 TRINITY_DN42538_c0_g1_i1:369-1832(-)
MDLKDSGDFAGHALKPSTAAQGQLLAGSWHYAGGAYTVSVAEDGCLLFRERDLQARLTHQGIWFQGKLCSPGDLQHSLLRIRFCHGAGAVSNTKKDEEALWGPDVISHPGMPPDLGTQVIVTLKHGRVIRQGHHELRSFLCVIKSVMASNATILLVPPDNEVSRDSGRSRIGVLASSGMLSLLLDIRRVETAEQPRRNVLQGIVDLIARFKQERLVGSPVASVLLSKRRSHDNQQENMGEALAQSWNEREVGYIWGIGSKTVAGLLGTFEHALLQCVSTYFNAVFDIDLTGCSDSLLQLKAASAVLKPRFLNEFFHDTGAEEKDRRVMVTALHLAARTGDEGMCSVILQMKADVDPRLHILPQKRGIRGGVHSDSDGNHSERSYYLEIDSELSDDSSSCGSDSEYHVEPITPLRLALAFGHEKVARMLRDSGAKKIHFGYGEQQSAITYESVYLMADFPRHYKCLLYRKDETVKVRVGSYNLGFHDV